MFKAMLVDDDFPVVQYWSQAIPWEELGFQFQGGFESGFQAMEHAREEVPDLLITDIGMPEMNGLELIASIKAINPKLQAVILSCHNDFQFAQKAVKLNVAEYMLKETLELNNMVELLNRIKGKMAEEANLEQLNQQLSQYVNENKSVLKTKFLRDLINNPLRTSQQAEEARKYKLDFDQTPYLPVLCYFDAFHGPNQKLPAGDIWSFAVENIMEEIFTARKHGICFGCQPNEFMLFFPKSQGNSMIIHRQIDQTLGEILHALKKFLKLDVSFIIGPMIYRFGEVKEKAACLLNSGDQQFFTKYGSIVYYKSPELTSNDIFLHYTQAAEQFTMAIIQKSETELEEIVARWMTHIQKEKYKPEFVKEWVIKILLEIKMKFNSLQKFQSSYLVKILHRTIGDIKTIYQLQEFMTNFAKEIIGLMQQSSQPTIRAEIMEAQRYVMLNLEKKITLADVADHIYLNASYFSRLYKKETGENFIDYVTRIKMERAKELLNQTNYTVEDISYRLGYDNTSYFNKTFKNFTNLTPYKYRGNEAQK